MFSTLKTKIWLTILSIVAMFALFTFIYFPSRQASDVLKSYNDEVQNLANTVALGVNIALNEQNYDGIKTAMEYVKNNPDLKFVSLVKTDTIRTADRTFSVQNTIVQTYPQVKTPQPDVVSNDSLIVKRSPFVSSDMSGFVLLGMSTASINETTKQMRITSLLISSLILLIGLLIGLWLARNISVPVSLLRAAARRVSDGDLSQVSIRHSNDEIGDLAKAFNKMLTDLFAAREELSSSNRNLSQANSALNKTLTDLKATQAQLVQSEKMASLGELTAGIAHEIQNPLNFVNNFSEVSIELAEELKEELGRLHLSAEDENILFPLADNLVQNQFKINHHGKRADAIVKGMLQHSRKNTGQKELTDINSLCDEYLRLSYHGSRARDKSFNTELKTRFDDTIGSISLVTQDIGRVLLNLFNNAFYAVNEKKKGSDQSYQPSVWISTKKLANTVEVRVKDNGCGVPKAILDKIFQPFFTTKPSGSGTGLGLSLSYDIITKQHGGTLSVRSEEGEYTEFIIGLPVV